MTRKIDPNYRGDKVASDCLDVASAVEILRCPSDGAALYFKGGQVRCTQCGNTYRDTDSDVVDLLGDNAYYWGEISQAQMERVLQYARGYGFDAAIDDLLGKEIDSSYRASLREPTRIDWRLLLGITREQRALDVGSGWGRLSFALAPWVEHLYSLEYVAQRLEFQRIMLQQRGDTNITLLRGSFLNLPFQSNVLDWVIFNGVFEWVGLAGTEDPGKMQLDTLKQAFEIVKPGGHVAIAIENRWGVNTFFGAIDHSGLPYTNLMPRRWADWWVRSRGARLRNDASSDGYRTYTYGLNSYLDLMRSAGADRIYAWALLPHYNTPRVIIPLHPKSAYSMQAFAIDAAWQRPSPVAACVRQMARFLARIGLMKYIYPHFFVVGRKK